MKSIGQKNWSKSASLMLFMTLAGAFLRFFRLDAQSFWGDEALSSLIAASTLTEVLSNAFASANPPGYYLLIHFWRSVAGGSDLALRLPSALMGVLGICLMYQLGRVIFTKRTGLWAAAITALAPFHVLYSQEARMYTQLHSLTCILILAYVRLWKGKSRWPWITFFLASAAGLWTHFFAWFSLALLGLHFLILKLWRGRFRSSSGQPADGIASPPSLFNYLVLNGTVLAVFSLYLPRFFDHVLMVKSATWRVPPPPSRLAGIPLALTVSQFLSHFPQLMALGLITSIVLVVGLQVARALYEKVPASHWLVLLSLWSLVPPTISFFISQVWRPVFAARYLTVSVPAFYLLLAWSATRTRERSFNKVLLIGLCILMGWGLHNWYSDPSFAKPPIEDVVRHVRRSSKSTSPVIHGIATSYWLFEHYSSDLDNHLLSDSPTTNSAQEILRKDWIVESTAAPTGGFWYIVFPIHSVDFQFARRDRFDVRFRREQDWQVGGIQAYYYADGDSSHR